MTARPGPLTFLLVLAGALARAAGATGTISGTVEAPHEVVAVAALDRATGAKYPGTLDAAAGRFTIAGLPVGKTFDCRIDYRGGARLEGVNLKVPRSDDEEEQPLSAEDVATISGQVRRLSRFEDEVDILAVSGNVQHSAVLVNKRRTRPFVNSKPGEVIWRCEVWHFERPEETWVKVQDELFLVLYRERIPGAEYKKKSITFDPALGGIVITKESPTIDLGAIKRPSSEPGIRLGKM